MTISVLLPTYNGADFLEEQVRSIMAQRFTDWELLICDDGSTDATVSVAAALASEDERIRILPSQGNVGQRGRLLQLVDTAKRDLIAVADQDDIWSQQKLALLIEQLGDHDLSFGPSWLIDGAGHEFGRDISASLPPAYRAGDRLTWIFRPLVSAHAMLVRRRLFGGAAFTRSLAFDWLISLEAAFGGGINYVPAARTLHRLHGANQSNGWFAEEPRAPHFVSRTAMKTLARTIERERLFVTGILEHLMFASTLDLGTRKRFAAAHQACENAWYPNWVGGYKAVKLLPQRLELILRPLAGSDQDWSYFNLRIEQLCTPLISPLRLLKRYRRHRAECMN